MTGVANMDGVVPLRPSSPGLYDLEASLKLAGGEMVD